MSRHDSQSLALERHRHLFDLDRDKLGEDLCKAATDGAQECIAGEYSPSGEGWEYLSPEYEEWKEFAYPGHPMALLHGVMANPRQVAGELDPPDRTRAIVTYGITEQARDEAAWFQRGNAHQPPRPFWGFTEDSREAARKILEARLKSG